MAADEIDIAGAVRGLAPMPSVAQPPLAGNGAHPVSSSAFAGCAHKFAGEDPGAGASRRSAVLVEPPESASQAPALLAASPAIQTVIPHQGTTILDLDHAAQRALAADRVIERISQVCPLAKDCAGPPENKDACRVYECEECNFRGCAACMEIHESEPHWSDGAAARERFGGKAAI